MPIYGKKTVLFPLEMVDIQYFANILSDDNRKRLINFQPEKPESELNFFLDNFFKKDEEDHESWVVKRLYNNVMKDVAFIYVYKYQPHFYQLIMLPDELYLSGLVKHIKSGNLTFLEDILQIIKNHYVSIPRLEIKIPSDDKIMNILIKKAGFKREGVLHDYACFKDSNYDVSVYTPVRG